MYTIIEYIQNVGLLNFGLNVGLEVSYMSGNDNNYSCLL